MYCKARLEKIEPPNVLNLSSKSKRKTTEHKWIPSLENCFDIEESYSLIFPHASMQRWNCPSIESICDFRR